MRLKLRKTNSVEKKKVKMDRALRDIIRMTFRQGGSILLEKFNDNAYRQQMVNLLPPKKEQKAKTNGKLGMEFAELNLSRRLSEFQTRDLQLRRSPKILNRSRG